MNRRWFSAVLVLVLSLSLLGAACPPSANNTSITLGSAATVTDSAGNGWGIPGNSGKVFVNSTMITATANAVQMAYASSVVWYKDNSANWRSLTLSPTAGVTISAATTTSPLITKTPIASPLATATAGTWQVGKQWSGSGNGPSGKPLQYNYLLPQGYDPINHTYPIMFVGASNGQGMVGSNDGCGVAGTYPRCGANFIGAMESDSFKFNTVAFRIAHPAIIVAPQCDQVLDGSGATFNSNCGGYADGAGTSWAEQAQNSLLAAFVGGTCPITEGCSVTPGQHYGVGLSLSAIGYLAQMVDNNSVTPTGSGLWDAGVGMSTQLFRPGIANSTVFARMKNVPYISICAPGDNPCNYDLPLWQNITGNTTYPVKSTYDSGGMAAIRAGTSNFYLINTSGGTAYGTFGCMNADGCDGTNIYAWLFQQQGNSSGASVGTGQFYVSGGKLFDPTGAQFIPEGVNVMDWNITKAVQNASAFPIKSIFPKLNYIRVAVCTEAGCSQTGADSNSQPTGINYPAVSSFSQTAAWCQTNKIVCEFEDHTSNGGTWEFSNSGRPISHPPTGGLLANITAYWASFATMCKGNPYCWIGSLNELGIGGDGSYTSANIAAPAAYHVALYNAIRATGNNNIIDICQGAGCGGKGTVGSAALPASSYANMTNIMFLLHVYGTDTAANMQALMVGQTTPVNGPGCFGYTCAQTIQSKDGIVPVIFNEAGSANGIAGNTDGAGLAAALTAVQSANVGSAPFVFYNCGNATGSFCYDQVNNGNTSGLSLGSYSLTTWGGEVASIIAANPFPGGTGSGGEAISLTALSSVAQNTSFTVNGTISGVSSAPTLQYQDNGGVWTALPSGAVVSTTQFSFTHPGMASNPAATVAVRDANNPAISATGPPFVVSGTASPNGTMISPGVGSFTDGTHTYIIVVAGTNGANSIYEDGTAIPGGEGTNAGEWWNGLPYFESGTTWFIWNNTTKTFSTSSPPGTAATESLSVTAITQQPANTPINVSGSILGLTTAPTLQYQNNSGAWTAFPAGSSVTSLAFSFTDPGLPISASNVINVRDANNTTITAASNTFATVGGTESANGKTVTTTIDNIIDAHANVWTLSSGSAGGTTSPLINPGQDGRYWKLPQQTTAVIDTTSAQVTTLRNGNTATVNTAANFAAPMYYPATANDPIVTVNGPNSKVLTTRLPLGAVIEQPPGTGGDQAIGGTDSHQPGLVWSAFLCTMTVNGATATAVAASGTVINCGALQIDWAYGPIMEDVVTGQGGGGNTYGCINDYELNQIFNNPSYVIPHMLAVTLGRNQINGTGIVWPLKVLDTAFANTGTLPQGQTYMIPANTVRPANCSSAGCIALWNVFQQFGGIFYNSGGASFNVTAFAQSTNGQTIANQMAADIAKLMPYMGILTLQTGPSTAKGMVNGVRSDAFPAPPLLDLTPIGGAEVSSATVGAYYPTSTAGFSVASGGYTAAAPAIVSGQVVLNGTADPATSNVVELAYVNGAVWYENASNLWFYNNTATLGAWLPVGGTANSPLNIVSSPNYTIVTTNGPAITDLYGNTFKLIVGAQVSINGGAGAGTNLVELAYVNNVVWRENSSLLWSSYSNGVWSATTSTSPLVVETIAVNPITAQPAGIPFTVSGTVTPVSSTPTLQYQDNAGPWIAFPTGSTVTLQGHLAPTFADFFTSLDISDTGGPATGAVVIITASPAGQSFVDTAGATWTIVGGVAKKNGSNAGSSSTVAEMALVGTAVWYENVATSWFSWSGTAWVAGANPLLGGPSGQWMNHYSFGGSEYTLSYNTELEYYSSITRAPFWQPFSLQNGGAGPGLIITVDTTAQAPFLAGHTPSNPLSLPYNTGQINSSTEIPPPLLNNSTPAPGILTFQYGYVEIQALLPGGPGEWIGYTMYPVTGSGEIDIIETGGDDLTHVHSTIHSSTTNVTTPVPVTDYTLNRHVYGVDWQPNFITFYVDHVQTTQVVTPTDMVGKPYYLALAIAIQGNPSQGFDGVPTAATVFPAQMMIDWVKLWPNFASSQSLIAGNTASWSFTQPALLTNPTNTINVRDAANTNIVGSSNGFAVTNNEALSINAVGVQAANSSFTVNGVIANAGAIPTLQYQNNGGAWTALPAGSIVTLTGFSFVNPGLPINSTATVSVRDANTPAIVATAIFSVIVAPTSAGWNAADTSTTITLSNNLLTATSTATALGGSRALAAYSTGKVCFDTTLNTVTPNTVVGLSNANYVLTGTSTAVVITASPPGQSLVDGTGATWTIVNGVALKNGTSPAFSSFVAELALVGGVVYQENTSAQWYYWTGTAWLGYNNGDPTAGAGSSPSSVLGANANSIGFFPAKAGAVQSISYNGAQVLAPAQGALTATSGGSLTDSLGHVWTLVATAVYEDGVFIAGSNGTGTFTIVNGLYYGQDSKTNNWFTYSTVTKIWSSATAPFIVAASVADVSGDTVTTCVDITAGKEWISTPVMRATTGVTWNSAPLAVADPAAGIGGVSFSGLPCPCLPTMSTSDTGTQDTINLAGPLKVPLPTGFLVWQPAVTILHHPFIFNLGQNGTPANDDVLYEPVRFERHAR